MENIVMQSYAKTDLYLVLKKLAIGGNLQSVIIFDHLHSLIIYA